MYLIFKVQYRYHSHTMTFIGSIAYYQFFLPKRYKIVSIISNHRPVCDGLKHMSHQTISPPTRNTKIGHTIVKCMYYMIYNDATLLHQKHDEIKKVYGKNRPILTIIKVWRQCLQVKHRYYQTCLIIVFQKSVA